MRVLSLGAGVQSSTLLLMACEGELQIDAAIFADTQWEPAAVYDWLTVLEKRAEAAGIPIYRVTAGNIRKRALEGTSDSWMPLHVINRRGQAGILRRQCTKNYKIRPIARQVRALGGGPKNPVTMIIGISVDEYQRMRTSDVKFITNEYPLVDQRMARQDCVKWLGDHGYSTPSKSSCVGCPYRNNAGWRALTPIEFADAVAFDHEMRDIRNARVQAFLHTSLVPLDMADLRSEQDRGQTEMFESDGCGVLCASEDA